MQTAIYSIDYSIYDAIQAGFGRVVCIIKPELEKDFDEVITKRLNGKKHKATVRVLPTQEKWYGVTYSNDMPKVQAALQAMRESGVYHEQLWR